MIAFRKARNGTVVASLIPNQKQNEKVFNFKEGLLASFAFPKRLEDKFKNYIEFFRIKTYKELIEKIQELKKQVESGEYVSERNFEFLNMLEKELKGIKEAFKPLSINLKTLSNYLKIAQVNPEVIEREKERIEENLSSKNYLNTDRKLEDALDILKQTKRKITNIDKTVDTYKVSLDKITYQNIYLQKKLINIERISKWTQETLNEKLVRNPYLQELAQRWDIRKPFVQNIESEGGLSNILFLALINSRWFKKSILGALYKIITEGIPKYANKIANIFVKELLSSGAMKAFKESFRELGKALKVFGRALLGSKGMKIVSKAFNIFSKSSGTQVASSVSKISRVTKSIGFMKKVPVVGTLLTAGAVAADIATAKTVAERNRNVGGDIGTAVGAFLGGLVPIPGVNIVTSMAGAYLGEKIGSYLGRKFTKPEDFVPDEIKSKYNAFQLVNIIDRAIHSASEQGFDIFTNAPFESKEEIEVYVKNLFEYKKELIKKKIIPFILKDAKGNIKTFKKLFYSNPESTLSVYYQFEYPETVSLIVKMLDEELQKYDEKGQIKEKEKKPKTLFGKFLSGLKKGYENLKKYTAVGTIVKYASKAINLIKGKKVHGKIPQPFTPAELGYLIASGSNNVVKGNVFGLYNLPVEKLKDVIKIAAQNGNALAQQLLTKKNISLNDIHKVLQSKEGIKAQELIAKDILVSSREIFNKYKISDPRTRALIDRLIVTFGTGVVEEILGNSKNITFDSVISGLHNYLTKNNRDTKALKEIQKSFENLSIEDVQKVLQSKRNSAFMKANVDLLQKNKMYKSMDFDNYLLSMLRKHETGSIKGNYAFAKDIGDRAGITFGAYQFTEKSGMIHEFIKRMAEAGDKDAQILLRRGYTREQLIEFLRKKGSTKLGKEIQDRLAIEKYINPAKKLAAEYGITDPNAIALIVDHALNTGIGGARKMLEIAKANGDLSAQGIALARKEHYSRIARANPHLRKFERGWLNRVDQNLTEIQKFSGSVPQTNIQREAKIAMNIDKSEPVIQVQDTQQKQENQEPVIMPAPRTYTQNDRVIPIQTDFLFEGFITGAFNRG